MPMCIILHIMNSFTASGNICLINGYNGELHACSRLAVNRALVLQVPCAKVCLWVIACCMLVSIEDHLPPGVAINLNLAHDIGRACHACFHLRYVITNHIGPLVLIILYIKLHLHRPICLNQHRTVNSSRAKHNTDCVAKAVDVMCVAVHILWLLHIIAEMPQKDCLCL